MDVAALKLDLIQWLAQIQDESLLKKIQFIRDSKEENLELSEEQLLELDQRLEKYERGEMNFSSWEKVKERVKNRAKNEI
ncbi:addiction module protein [Algoriphagus boritolerans]|uniref:Putative addiction module component, TIGR02574 family n=1 Tax=Algoriphagus boritolerans DSM 17298 = JCM 18970 TaxID=1120964 RepID=A0A1H5V9Q8_9BACT|nr:addiction module protein [Algoriphagus boritolerans]SEF84069.1 putative addiction module component, TIGR02574 family [Algoriphagus boritolerans DSM 17298 = JCM 18970]